MKAILDRKKPPKYHSIEKIEFTKAQPKALDNGVPAYWIDAGRQPIVKVEFVFDAGSWNQPAPLVASTVNAMLNEGSKNFCSQQIAETMDFFGAYLNFEIDRHYASVSLYSLNKHLPQTLAIVADLLRNPLFPEQELEIFLKKQKQSFQVEMQKVVNLARIRFYKALFGASHPYGQVAQLEDFDRLSRADLVSFFENYYHKDSCKIIVAGQTDDSMHTLLNRYFGDSSWQARQKPPEITAKLSPEKGKEFFVEKPDAVQSALRVGKRFISRTHPDFITSQILNSILGGYFGSRLMSNVREKKGYTYGIDSVLVSLPGGSYFTIISEVGSGVCRNAIKEIYAEIQRLQTELVSAKELALVRNYLFGEMLRSFDGAFAKAESFKVLLLEGLDYSYYETVMETLRSITPQELRQVANKHFSPSEMIAVAAGQCKEKKVL